MSETKLYRQTDEGIEVIDGRKAWGVDIPAYAYDLWMPVIGLDTLALYGVLWRLARNNQTKIGLEKLAKSTRRGKKTLIKDMEILKTCGFINYTTPSETQRKQGIPTRFEIFDIPTTVSQALIDKYSPNEYKPLTWWLIEEGGVGSNNPTVGSNGRRVGSNRTFNDPLFDPLFEKDSLSFAFESEIFLLAPQFILRYGSEVYRVYPKPKKPTMTKDQGRVFDMHQRMFWEDLAFYATICHLPADEQKRVYKAHEAAQRKAAIDADVAKTTRQTEQNTDRDEMTQQVITGWKVTESFARKIAKLLSGKFNVSGDKKLDKRDEQWIEHNLTTPITAADVLPFVAWYEKTNTKKDGTPINLPDNPQDIAKWVTRWVMLGKPNPLEQPQLNKNSALSGVKLVSKGAAA